MSTDVDDGHSTYPGFGGRVGRVFGTSRPWWPEPITPRDDAPNVIVVLADDLGFSDLGSYGSEIDTPNLDALAERGLRYTNFHVNPMCSPTRASLMTGVNAHAAGVGVVAHYDPGFPGYASELAPDVATMAEVFRHNGYATLMVGKWHLTKEIDLSEGASKHSWPTQRGFDRFYGFLDAFTNLHQPHQLYEDNHAVQVDRYPDDYYLTDDLTDRAMDMIRAVRAFDPRKPFFLYFAHGAVHAPLHARPADIAKYAGRYDEGWDRLRSERFERQLATGLLPDGVRLPPRNTEPGHDVRPWDELSETERRLYARYMEIYAGMVDSVDQSFGRLVELLTDLGELDNTLIVFLSDNGASPEGSPRGTSYYLRTTTGETAGKLDDFEADLARFDLLGGPRSWPHYPRGWAMACNTPFRLYKRNTHAGGHQVPFILSWPAYGVPAGGLRRQYAHVTDLLPTFTDLLGLRLPERAELRPFDGTSFMSTLQDAGAPSRHREQYYENLGNRGQYADGWEAVTLHLPGTAFSADRWELYHLAQDPTELEDLATEEPSRLAALEEDWERAAWANLVFPLDEGTGLKKLLRPPAEAVLGEPLTLLRGTPTLERYRSQALILMRAFEVRVKVEPRAGDEGVLVAHGDQGGGYVLYVEDGRLVFTENAYGQMKTIAAPLPDATTEITVDVGAPGGLVWTVRLAADGHVLAEADDFVMLASMAPYEGIDVGIDRRSPVSWDLYSRRGPFPFTGRIVSVAYVPGELAPDARARRIHELIAEAARFE